MLKQIEKLEGAVGELHGARELSDDARTVPANNGLGRHGLTVGSPAPAFSLDGLDGRRSTLDQLLSSGRPLMLVFSAAGCGPCDAMMPELAAWQREHAERLTIVPVASGHVERNREKAAASGVEAMLFDSERAVAIAYHATGTPMAVVIDGRGLINGPTVGGSDAITKLLAEATHRSLEIVQVPAGNGHADQRPHRTPPVGARQVGEAAPPITLPALAGEPVAVAELPGRTVLLFWNPSCGFCQRMRPALNALHESEASRVVLISASDAAAIRDQQLPVNVLLDPTSSAAQTYGATGTPMAVAIDGGSVHSQVVAGSDAVLELIRGATEHDGSRAPASDVELSLSPISQ